jgi:peptidylprolyl isomerase
MAVDEGNTVSLHYTGKLDSGEVFDTSDGRGPLEFKVGAGMVIPGFDRGVVGMEVGEKKTVTIPPDEGYGAHDPQLVQTLERSQLDAAGLEPGQVLGLQAEDGRQFQATVLDVDDESVKLDFNHFLAGKTLVFDIEIVGIE